MRKLLKLKTMKYFFILTIAVLLYSCSKSDVALPQNSSNSIFYRIVEIDTDGSIFYTPVQHVEMYTDNLDGDWEDDDDDDDDDDHYPLPIKIKTFTAIRISSKVVRIQWSAENESSVLKYLVERSDDTKTWKVINQQEKLSNSIYEIFDKPRL